MTYFTIGADVEVFAKDVNGNHKALCGLIGGTKEKPKQIDVFGHGYCVQEDNVSLEFNIPAVDNKLSFKRCIQKMVDYSESVIKQQGFELSKVSSASFNKMELVHPNALVFGCEPDYDAWKQVENKKPRSNDETLRTCGGHVHVGTDKNMVELIKNLDLYLGVPSVLLDDSPESIRRRELYGKAGAMRPKPYGAEYRVLSNFWIFKPELIGWVYDGVASAIKHKAKFTKQQALEIQNCINTGDKDAAKAIIGTYGITLPV